MTLAEKVKSLRADKVPRGWLTRREFARTQGYTNPEGGFYYVLLDALARGLIIEKKFNVLTPAGILRPTRHFKRVR